MSIYDSLSIQLNDNSSKEAADSLSIGANDTLSRSLGNALSGVGPRLLLAESQRQFVEAGKCALAAQLSDNALDAPSAGARAVARWPGQCWYRGQVDAQRVRTQPHQRV